MLGGPSGAGNRIGVGCIHGINRCTTVSPAPPLGTRVSRHFHGLLPLPGMPFPIYQQGCFLYLLQMLRYHPSEPSSHKQQTFIPFCSLPISVSLSSYLHSFFWGGGFLPSSGQGTPDISWPSQIYSSWLESCPSGDYTEGLTYTRDLL